MLVAVCLYGQPQTAPSKETPDQAKGLPPRATPGDYQAQAQAGPVTIAAEFKGHSIPTAQGTLTTEDYVVVEIGVFGPTDSHVKLAADEFTLRINDKKGGLQSQPFGVVLSSAKDPEYEPPAPQKSKLAGLTGGPEGGEKPDKNAPPPPLPLEVQRGMAQRVRKAALPEGDRVVPVAGLLFFQYRGKQSGVHSVELQYAGSAGKATLKLQP